MCIGSRDGSSRILASILFREETKDPKTFSGLDELWRAFRGCHLIPSRLRRFRTRSSMIFISCLYVEKEIILGNFIMSNGWYELDVRDSMSLSMDRYVRIKEE